jgi:hypothetical protein
MVPRMIGTAFPGRRRMRWKGWLFVACSVLLVVSTARAKPPGLPGEAGGEGRVPVYPDGEQYREPAPRDGDVPRRAPPKSIWVEISRRLAAAPGAGSDRLAGWVECGERWWFRLNLWRVPELELLLPPQSH